MSFWCVKANNLCYLLFPILRTYIHIIIHTFIGYPGWTSVLPAPHYVTDGTVAMMGALALFVIPRRDFFSNPREMFGEVSRVA